MKNQVKQSLPKCFDDKMKIDRIMEQIVSNPIINFHRAKRAVLRKQTYRYRCQEHIKRSRTNPGSATSA